MAFIEQHFDALLGALGGGVLTQIANWGINRKKGKEEGKGMEIENIKRVVDEVYKPLIEQQNGRIKELETEVRTLREERARERDSYQKQIATLQKQIVDITRALGLKANEQLRNAKGQFIAKQEEQ